MDLYQELENKLARFNAVKTVNHTYYRYQRGWAIDKVKPETTQDFLENYELVRKLYEVPHSSRKVGTALVIERLDLATV